MADFDSALALALDEVLPPSSEQGDWERVLRDANQVVPPVRGGRPHWRTSRVVLVAAVLIVAALIPLVAVAANQGWWFFAAASRAPAPASPVVVVERGSWHATPWALTAYRTKRQGLCIGFTPNPPSGPPPTPTSTAKPVGILGCGAPVRGIPDLPATRTRHELVFYATEENDNVTVLAGPTASDVTEVQLVHADGSTTKLSTVAAPPSLHAPIRFFTALLNLHGTTEIKAVNRDGHVVQTATLTASSAATPGSNTYKIQWGS